MQRCGDASCRKSKHVPVVLPPGPESVAHFVPAKLPAESWRLRSTCAVCREIAIIAGTSQASAYTCALPSTPSGVWRIPDGKCPDKWDESADGYEVSRSACLPAGCWRAYPPG